MRATSPNADSVRRAYSAAARRPRESHPFPIGGAFAAKLGYPAETLEGAPRAAVDAFTGVSNVGHFAEVAPGWTVLDLGCGAGLDSLLASQKTGPAGHVIGIDFSAPMLWRARRAASENGLGRISFIQSTASRLPLSDSSVDAALVNGIFNLNRDRSSIFAELARVIKKDGRVWAAELVLTEPLPTTVRDDEANWFA